MEVENENPYYLSLYKAAVFGNWTEAEAIFNNNPGAQRVQILTLKETALHVAISSGHSIVFVKELVKIMPDDSLETPNANGDTPLHYAALAGNKEAAEILIQRNPELTGLRNKKYDTPLHTAAKIGHKETVASLLSVTRHIDPSSVTGQDGLNLLIYLITSELYDIAFDLLTVDPMLASMTLGDGPGGYSALDALAQKPQAFKSGSQLGWFQRLQYHYFAGRTEGSEESKQCRYLNHIQNTVLKNKQAMKLLKLLTSEASKASPDKADILLGRSALLAVTYYGIPELVKEAIKSYPGTVWIQNGDGHNVFHLAVKHRREDVFNLLYQMGTHKHFTVSSSDNSGNTMLHLAGISEPSNKVAGAALQMQRELQWFKAVEKIVQPSHKEVKNNAWKSPREVFTEEHKTLVKEGQEWMKQTASSCGTVAALVVTVVFTAAFNAPGGKSGEGIPIYLKQTSFMVFAIADALALFSSSTSLLTFLGILTSRYSEEDFLRALPMRLSIGLITLFFSIASMLTAFSSAYHLVMFHKVRWIAIPIGLVACVPAALFAFLQFPLLVEIVHSTFGPSIFGKKSNEIIF